MADDNPQVSVRLHEKMISHPFCSKLDMRWVEELTWIAEEVTFPSGQVIFREGDRIGDLYLIHYGNLALEIFSHTRGHVVILTVGEGDILGNPWRTPGQRSRVDVRAQSLARAIRLDGTKVREACDRNREMGYDMARVFIPVLAAQIDHTYTQMVNVYES